MYSRNSIGTRISLLNDSGVVAAAPSKTQLPQLIAHSHSQPSSTSTTPSLSPTPRTPFPEPSPLTPSYTFEAANSNQSRKQPEQQHYFRNNSYSKMDDPAASLYPPIPDMTAAMPSAYPMPPQMPPHMPSQIPSQAQPPPQQQIYRTSDSPSSEPSRLSTISATSNSKSQPKKNQYPCPMAKQVGCTDYFTTSGHAARHAKKHTGKKDAYCPDCNKAFTRKDNMEQHRRTHQNGRGASRSNNGDEAKVKKTTKPSGKKSAIKVEPQLFEAAIEQQLAEQKPIVSTALPVQLVQAQQAQAIVQQQAIEQALMMPPSGPYFVNNTMDAIPVPPLPQAMPELSMRPTLQRANFTSSLDYIPPAAPSAMSDLDALHYSYPSPGLSNGLNSLALAASEHRRLSEEKSQSLSPQTPSQEAM